MLGKEAWQASLVTPEQNRRSISTPKTLETTTKDQNSMLYINNEIDIFKNPHQSSSDQRIIYCHQSNCLKPGSQKNGQPSYFIKVQQLEKKSAVLSWYKKDKN